MSLIAPARGSTRSTYYQGGFYLLLLYYRGDLPIRNWPKAMCLLCFLKMKKLTGPNRLWFLKSVEIGCPSTNQGPPRPAGSRAAGANRGIS